MYSVLRPLQNLSDLHSLLWSIILCLRRKIPPQHYNVYVNNFQSMCWVRRSFPGIREAGRVGWLTALQRADGPAALQPHTGVKWWPLGWEHRVSSVSAELTDMVLHGAGVEYHEGWKSLSRPLRGGQFHVQPSPGPGAQPT